MPLIPQMFRPYRSKNFFLKWPSIITGTPKCFDLPPCLARLTTLKSPKSCFCIISDTWIGWGVMTWHSLGLPRPRLRGGFAWKIMQIKPFIRCLQMILHGMYTAKNVVEVACAYHLFPPLSLFVQMKDMVLHVCTVVYFFMQWYDNHSVFFLKIFFSNCIWANYYYLGLSKIKIEACISWHSKKLLITAMGKGYFSLTSWYINYTEDDRHIEEFIHTQ